MEGLLKQSTAVNITVLVISSSDHISGLTGATLTTYATKAAGTPALITPTVTELDPTNVPGLYKLALTTAHTGTLGELQLHVTATSADPTDIVWQVVAFDPTDAVALGLSDAAQLNVTTYAEPIQGTPAASITLAQKISYLYKAWRNKTTQTASQYSLYNDAGSIIDQKGAFSDDGSTATRNKITTGP